MLCFGPYWIKCFSMNKARNEQDEIEAGSAHSEGRMRRDFRRGNINFDFLQPDDEDGAAALVYEGDDRRTGRREGKRGLFNRGRPSQPIGAWQLWAWLGLFLLSGAGAGFLIYQVFWGLAGGGSVLLLLLLPFLLASLFWSLLMLVLLKARPR